MDKRALIGIALSVLVLVAYQQYINYFYGAPPAGTAPAPSATGGGEKAPAPQTPSTPPSPAPLPAVATGAANKAAAKQPAKEITVATDQYSAVFTTHGGRLKSFKFKKFH